jgi:SAM-dependent MidA family methyltransferase
VQNLHVIFFHPNAICIPGHAFTQKSKGRSIGCLARVFQAAGMQQPVSAALGLSEILSDKIAEQGPLRFDQFMDHCLYYPDYGYYTSGKLRAGPSRDFATSPTLTNIFGKLLALQLREMWALCGKGDFSVLEYGAGDGSLCCQILEYARAELPEFYASLQYFIVEKNGIRSSHEKITCLSSVEEMEEFSGCVLTNEVLDNFPVRVIEMNGGPKEMLVSARNGIFCGSLVSANDEVSEYLEFNKINLPDGIRFEFCPGLRSWLSSIRSRMKRGFILTIDYGFVSASELAVRKNGSLRSYRSQRLCESVFDDPGTQDVTAHVHFFALRNYGRELCFQDQGICSQAMFMRGAGLGTLLSDCSQAIDSIDALNRLHTLMLGIGNRFFVQVMSKGIEVAGSRLSGMQFAFRDRP